MSDELSILRSDEHINLETNRSDITAVFLKGLLSAAPFVGPLLAETLGMAIPNQKLERIVRFAGVFEDKVRHLEQDTVKLKMKTEEFADLLEDGVIQATRALSDKRRQYIASLLKNSISNETLAHVEEKKLLALLGELNDAEILTLKFYSLTPIERKEFAELHPDLFTPIRMTFGSPEENFDKGALRTSYRNKLMEVGLVAPVYKRPEKGKLPEFDEKTGQLKATSFRASRLGQLLLRYIDEPPTADGDARAIE